MARAESLPVHGSGVGSLAWLCSQRAHPVRPLGGQELPVGGWRVDTAAWSEQQPWVPQDPYSPAVAKLPLQWAEVMAHVP